MWSDILAAIALVLVIEGIVPFVNPSALRRALAMIAQMNDQTLRFTGLTSMVLGILLLNLVR
jgi:uncharacterized protein YjeT (DUF2065 family)